MKKPIFKTEEGRQKIIANYKNTLKALPIDYTEQFVDTAFGRTYTLQAGDREKPPVILLHGSSSNSAMWLYDIAVLSNEHHVISVDIIGESGNSEPKRLDLKTDEYALWLDEVITGLRIKNPAIVGNSYGGWLALKYASVFPQKVSCVVLIAPSGIVNVKLSFVRKSIAYLMQGEKGIAKLNEYVFGTKDIPKEVLETGSLIMENFNPMTGGLPVFSDEQLGKISAPVLFIAGENDVTMDSGKAAQGLKKLVPKAQTSIIKDSGHVVYNAVETYKPFIERGELK